MGRIMRYPARMEKLTVNTLRTLAGAQGLELSDAELASLLPLVEAGRSGLTAIRDIPPETEPASQFRIF
ncbi:MAG TPA: hypothetical protein VF948_07080 [Methylomirabilota bacterium]